MSSFTKHDTGKPEFDIVSQFAYELGVVNKVMAFGANKYGMDNWRKCTPSELRRYRNATIRHALAAFREPVDSDSGLPHFAHAITNLLFCAYLERSYQPTTKPQTEEKEMN